MSPTGHMAIGFAAKRMAPDVSIIAFLISAYALDLLYFIFLVIGIDTLDFDPWSHSFLMALVWSILLGGIFLLYFKKLRIGLVIWLVVFSHWVLDVIVWDNIPIGFDRTQTIGLGLFSKIGFSLTNIQLNTGTIIASSIELTMLVVGLAIYITYIKKSRKQSGKITDTYNK